jgi:radical SAM superfamily enzyme YgiQ (UPF0313 family)
MAISASLLKQAGHEVLLIDGVAEGGLLEGVYPRITDFKPEVVFIETSTPSLEWDQGVLRELRRLMPNVTTVAGGTHAAALVPQWLAENPVPDYWLAGEYEKPLVELLARLQAGQALDGLPGLIWRGHGGGAPVHTSDIDGLPAPLFEQLPMQNYGDPVCGLPAPVAQSWLSRGCPFGCTFCVWPQLIYGNRRYRARSIQSALDEVQQLITRYGCESFYFDDDTANFGENRMVLLADAIIKRGLNQYPWSMMARADCMTPRSLEALAGAGLYSIKYGVESSSAALVDACHKGTRLEAMLKSIDLTRKLGIKMHLTFTFGLPGETEETIRATTDFAINAAPETAQFSLCTPFPGTVFYEECRQNGWLITEDWAHFLGSDEAVVNTPLLSSDGLMQGYGAAVKRWHSFAAERLGTRQQRLVAALLKVVDSGLGWELMGDPDFAEFIWKDPQADQLRAAMGCNGGSKAQQLVIISRHDEERLWRRGMRAAPDLYRHALRLFGPA